MLLRRIRPLLLIGIVFVIALTSVQNGVQRQRIAAQDAATITILTYNVSDDNEEVDDLIPWLNQQTADVMALQEVSLGWDERMADALAATYPYHSAYMDTVNWRATITFSRTPFLQTASLDALESVYTQLCLGGRTIDFYNVSLDTPFSEGNRDITGISFLDLSLRYNEDHQIEQVEQLLAALDESAAPVILAGDFNLTDQSLSYRLLAARFADSFDEAGSGSGLTWPAAAKYDLPSFIPPLLRIDYVWHSDQFETQSASVANGVGSDHLPVLVQLGDAAEASFPACTLP